MFSYFGWRPERRRLRNMRADPLVEQATDLDAVLQLLAQEAVRAKRRRIFIGGGYLLAFVAIPGTLAIATHWHMANFSWMSGVWSGGFGAAFAASKRQKQAASKVAQFDDVRAAGPLLEALYYNDKAVEQEARTALERLLPRLQASDSSALNENQRKLLRKSLGGRRRGRKPDGYILSGLKALEQVGTPADIDAVESLRQYPEPVSSAATACLEVLRERERDDLLHGRLLRPAMPAAGDMNVLVRPAGVGYGTETSLLVRPVEGEVAGERVQTIEHENVEQIETHGS